MKLKKYIIVLVNALIVVLLLFLLYSECDYTKIITSGIPWTQSADMYTEYLYPGEVEVKQEFIPQHNKLDKISIRVENEQIEEMKGNLAFEILDFEGKKVWSTIVDETQIEDWHYIELDVSGSEAIKGRHYWFVAYCPRGEETYPYRFFLSNDRLAENNALFYNNNAVNHELDIVYVYRGINWLKLTLVVIGMISFIFSQMMSYGQIFISNKIISYFSGFIEIIWALSMTAIVEYLSMGDIRYMTPTVVALNVIIVITVYMFCILITGRSSFSILLSTILIYIFSLINHFTIVFRGTPFLPMDILSISTAMNVADNYTLEIDENIVIATELIIAIIALNCYLLKMNGKMARKRILIIFGLLASCVFIIGSKESIQTKLGTHINQSAQMYSSQQMGYLLCYIENIQYSRYKRPQGYSKKRAQEILESAGEIDSNKDKPDNIIVIMNESFTDLRELGNVSFSDKYLPNYDIVKSFNCSKQGKVVCSVFGGGTSSSEFEFLTGCSMYFVKAGNAPYQQHIHKDTDSLASFFKQDGMQTIALHPANPKSWKRDIAYPLLGFDKFLNIESEEFKDATYCRYWADDESLMKQLNEEINNTDKAFEFGLTIQCHGGYDYSKEDFINDITISNYEDDNNYISQYLTLENKSDESYGDLIRKIGESEEKTIVLMFGDHLPALPVDFYQSLLGREDYLSDIKMYETPYIIWSNYECDFSDFPDVMSVNFMAPYLLKAAGYRLDEYYSFLYKLSQEYPIVSRAGIYDADMNEYFYEQESNCYKMIHEYDIVQYNKLFN